MNVHARTLLILLGSFMAVIVLFGVFVYFSASGYTDRDFDRLLELRVKAIAARLDDPDGTMIGNHAIGHLIDRLSDEQDAVVPLDSVADARALAARIGAPIAFATELLRAGQADDSRGKRHFKGLVHHGPRGSSVIVASAENYYQEHHVMHLRQNLLVGFVVAFVLALSISLYFSTTMFKPLLRITDRVRRISTESLHLRVPEDQGSRELRDLSSTFNYMLDRIETAFETQNNFISNASHELRTPLTAIIGEADVALSKERSTAEYQETIQVILEEAGLLERKTQALLFLAQTGFKSGRAQMDKVRMDELLYSVKSTVERVNPRYKVQLDLSLLPENHALLKVLGNEQLLHLAFSNIIVNGSKYSDSQPVTVSLGTSDDRVIVVVKDIGIGISTSDLEHIYDPFFRGGNTKGYEGYGIGLPLTRNIIRMHGGELLVSSILKVGTTVQVRLPIGRFEAQA